MLEVALVDNTELDRPIGQLLDLLDGVADGLRQLRSDGASFDIYCYLGSHSLEHCAILHPTVLRRIADLPAELWLDVYPDDEHLDD